MTEEKINDIGLLKALETRPVLCAEGYIFELERRGYIKAGPFVPEVVLEHPEAVEQLHGEFIRAGSDVVVACTYYGHRSKLKSIDREDALGDLNFKALEIAKRMAAENGALVAGNLSNTWEYSAADPGGSAKAVKAIFKEQVAWAATKRVDFVIAETFSHVGEALIALESIKEAGLPAVITFTTTQQRSCDGYSWEDACSTLEKNGADVVGLNCGRGPETMLPILARIRDKVQGNLAALPVPYRTTAAHSCFFDLKHDHAEHAFPVALEPFLLTRYEMADFAVKAKQIGVNYIGICCGAGPHHVRSMAEALGRTVPAGKYSPDISVHPIFGDQESKVKHHIECLYGPNVTAPKNQR